MSTMPSDLPEPTQRRFQTRIEVWMRLLVPQVIARVVVEAVKDQFFN